MSLNELKTLLLILTLACGLVGGLLPVLLDRRAPGRASIGAGNAFAAGLFLSIGLLHFLPESAGLFRDQGTGFPVASLLAIAAFMLLLLLEHVVSPEQAHEAAHAHSGEGSHAHGEDHRPASPYLLAFALSAHSMLAGIALGVETEARGATLTFLAIAAHKGTAGLALGLSLVHSRIPRARAFKLVSIFALMTPLGILTGILAGAVLRGDSHLLFDATATALAAGAFLYIGAFDLFQDEFLRLGRRWVKWLCALAGVLMAALLSAWL